MTEQGIDGIADAVGIGQVAGQVVHAVHRAVATRQIDNLVAVVGEDDLDQVLADVVDVASPMPTLAPVMIAMVMVRSCLRYRGRRQQMGRGSTCASR